MPPLSCGMICTGHEYSIRVAHALEFYAEVKEDIAYLVGADIKPSVHLDRVCTDNFSTKALCQLYRCLGLSHSRCPGQDDDLLIEFSRTIRGCYISLVRRTRQLSDEKPGVPTEAPTLPLSCSSPLMLSYSYWS